MDYETHYRELFKPLEMARGTLDSDTLTSIIGFSAGGPVSLVKIEKKSIYVTCELSVYPEQKRSAEGFRFELLSLGSFDAETCRSVFTALGALSMDATLGNGHTVDVSGVVASKRISNVKLKLFSKSTIDNELFGVYEVLPA
jgi:hypothetical protein